MAVTNQPSMKTLETIKVKGLTNQSLEKKIGRSLGSPINSKNAGEQFEVTLTGEIDIREFEGQKSAYFKTKEGYSLRVNASFNPSVHKEGAKFTAICREFARQDGTLVKFTAFVA